MTRGDAKHACSSPKKESDSYNCRMKRRHTRHLCNLFLDRLFRKDPAVHALLKKQTRFKTTPVSAPVWHDHLHRHFRVARTFEKPHPSAVGMAVPCSKDHPPPEVLFRRGEQSGWTPDPDEFEIPDFICVGRCSLPSISKVECWCFFRVRCYPYPLH